jgi:hypothetical protein
MELAGLEPATSWVRSRIRGFLPAHESPRIGRSCREFGLKLCLAQSRLPLIAVHVRVAYGLQGSFALQATPKSWRTPFNELQRAPAGR